MKPQSTYKLIAVGIVLAGAGSAFSQHSPAGHGHSPAVAGNPYAGQQAREIKALSTDQTQDLLVGKGMELAKAAELNGYPGPMHTLDLAQQLDLTPGQKLATQTLLASHKAEARALGTQLVEAERTLDQAFSSRQVDANAVTQQTRRIGELQAALRAAHLQTHLQQTALMTPDQVTRYSELRGYSAEVDRLTPASRTNPSTPSTRP